MALKKRHMLSYLAGIFDGEGYVGIVKISARQAKRPNPNFRAHCAVQMSERIIPQLFQNVFGGTVYRYKLRNPNYKTLHKWVVRDCQCIDFLKELMPYLIIKYPEAEIVLHFAENKTNNKFCKAKPLTEEELALREAEYILCQSLKKEQHA